MKAKFNSYQDLLNNFVTFCEMFGILWHLQFYANAILIGFDVADITSSTGEGLQQPRGKILRFLHSTFPPFNEG